MRIVRAIDEKQYYRATKSVLNRVAKLMAQVTDLRLQHHRLLFDYLQEQVPELGLQKDGICVNAWFNKTRCSHYEQGV